MSKKVVTGKVRGSYVNVFQPKMNDLSGNEEYSMMILIPKEDKETLTRLSTAIKKAQSDKWGNKVPTNARNPLKNGNNEDDLPESARLGDEPYADHYFMNVKSKQKPGIVDKTRQAVLDPEDFMSGDYCRVALGAYAYDQKGNRGVSFGLQNIQVLGKGEPLGGRTRAENDFDDFIDKDSDDDGIF